MKHIILSCLFAFAICASAQEGVFRKDLGDGIIAEVVTSSLPLSAVEPSSAQREELYRAAEMLGIPYRETEPTAVFRTEFFICDKEDRKSVWCETNTFRRVMPYYIPPAKGLKVLDVYRKGNEIFFLRYYIEVVYVVTVVTTNNTEVEKVFVSGVKRILTHLKDPLLGGRIFESDGELRLELLFSSGNIEVYARKEGNWKLVESKEIEKSPHNR